MPRPRTRRAVTAPAGRQPQTWRRAAVAAMAAASLTACSAAEPAAAPASQAVAGPASGGGSCGSVETPALQGGSHLLGDQPPPVPYASTPPTSGWHSSGAFSIGVRGPSEALSEPEQVSVLEAGGVVATYRDLSEGDRGALEEAATMAHAGRVAVTPYDRLQEGEVAFTAWGALQRCDGLDLGALASFVDTYADPEPAVPGEH